MDGFLRKRGKLLSGPAAFVLGLGLLSPAFGPKGAAAMGMAVWMALWWVFRPVDIAVTSMLPIVINAVFDLIPAAHVISQYFSEIVVLLLGADLLCLTWHTTGLDRRISVRVLCNIGSSMKQQVFAWLAVSTVLSVFLPNVVVAAILCPIAVAMLEFLGDGQVDRRMAMPILLAIGWGSGIGGFGSPIGGSANLVAISYLENLLGHEFMYVDWVVRFLPILVLIAALNLVFLWHYTPDVHAHGSRDYFRKSYAAFGPMKRGERIGLWLFVLAAVLVFLRPLYDGLVPGLKPAYSFLCCGFCMFFLHDENAKPMLTWKYAEHNIMWGMMFLFASGMALGRVMIETGAVDTLAAMLASCHLAGGLGTVAAFVVFASCMSEVSSNTAAVSIALPIVLSISAALGLDPVAYVLVVIVAANCAYVLPVSTRAIPVGFGLDAATQIRLGLRLTVLNMIVTTVVGYLCLRFIPQFEQL